MASHSTIFISTMFSAENLTQIWINRKKNAVHYYENYWKVGTNTVRMSKTYNIVQGFWQPLFNIRYDWIMYCHALSLKYAADKKQKKIVFYCKIHRVVSYSFPFFALNPGKFNWSLNHKNYALLKNNRNSSPSNQKSTFGMATLPVPVEMPYVVHMV